MGHPPSLANWTTQQNPAAPKFVYSLPEDLQICSPDWIKKTKLPSDVENSRGSQKLLILSIGKIRLIPPCKTCFSLPQGRKQGRKSRRRNNSQPPPNWEKTHTLLSQASGLPLCGMSKSADDGQIAGPLWWGAQRVAVLWMEKKRWILYTVTRLC